MAVEVASRSQERTKSRKNIPFASLVKRLTNFKSNTDNPEKSSSNKKSTGSSSKHRKFNTLGSRNNPYPLSGNFQTPQQTSQPSFSTGAHIQNGNNSCLSLPINEVPERDGNSQSNKSGAPTLATQAGTIDSDAGQSKAATTATGGVVSSVDGVGAGSTFSSPNHSEHSLTTTLTTIQSTSQSNTPAPGATIGHHNQQSQPIGSSFSHQFPVSSAPSGTTASAIPRHVLNNSNAPNTYNSATANNLLTDNASILTLASSSKRRRRSIDTDQASLRALAPSSVWGGSRESLPLSVLSGHMGPSTPAAGIGSPSAERASVYSSSGLVRDRDSVAPALTDRNSYYGKQPSDAKSLRSIHTNMKDDARSLHNADARSINADARSINDVASLRGGHARTDSNTGLSASPLMAPAVHRQLSNAGTAASMSRRSSDWREIEEKDELDDNEATLSSQDNPDEIAPK